MNEGSSDLFYVYCSIYRFNYWDVVVDRSWSKAKLSIPQYSSIWVWSCTCHSILNTDSLSWKVAVCLNLHGKEKSYNLIKWLYSTTCHDSREINVSKRHDIYQHPLTPFKRTLVHISWEEINNKRVALCCVITVFQEIFRNITLGCGYAYYSSNVKLAIVACTTYCKVRLSMQHSRFWFSSDLKSGSCGMWLRILVNETTTPIHNTSLFLSSLFTGAKGGPTGWCGEVLAKLWMS